MEKSFNTVWIQIEEEMALVWDREWVFVNLEDNTVLANSDILSIYNKSANEYISTFIENDFLGEVESNLFYTSALKYPSCSLGYKINNKDLSLENLNEEMIKKMVLDYFNMYGLSNLLGDDWNESKGIFVVGKEKMSYEEINACSIIEALYTSEQISAELERLGFEDIGELYRESQGCYFEFLNESFYLGDDAYVWEYFDEDETLAYALEEDYYETLDRFTGMI